MTSHKSYVESPTENVKRRRNAALGAMLWAVNRAKVIAQMDSASAAFSSLYMEAKQRVDEAQQIWDNDYTDLLYEAMDSIDSERQIRVFRHIKASAYRE